MLKTKISRRGEKEIIRLSSSPPPSPPLPPSHPPALSPPGPSPPPGPDMRSMLEANAPQAQKSGIHLLHHIPFSTFSSSCS